MADPIAQDREGERVQASVQGPAHRSWRHLWRRAGEIWRDDGPAGLLFLVLADLGYRRALLLERPIGDPITPINARVPVEFAALDPSEIGAYLQFYAGDTREVIEARFARGDVCHVARHEGRIVCTSWLARGEHFIRFLRFRYEIPADEGYLYDSYTSADHRGQSIAPALGVFVLERLRDAGVKRATMAVVPENTANLNVRARTGFRVCGRIRALLVGRRAWHWRSDAS